MTWFKRLTLMLLVMSGTFVTVAQESTEAIQPIIAYTVENDIYAVSPIDGSATLLVDRDEILDAALDEATGSFRLGLSQMSPDEMHIAYTAPLYEILEPFYDNRRERLRYTNPHDVYLLNVYTGESVSITEQASRLPQIINSGRSLTHAYLTWSPDGGRLYFATYIYPLSESQTESMQIDYYDLATGEMETLIPDFSHNGLYRLYPVADGLITLTLQAGGNPDFSVSLYSLDGELIEQIETSIPNWMSGSVAELNPLIYEEQEVVGIIDVGDETFGNVRLLNVIAGGDDVLSENDHLALTSRSGLNDGSDNVLYAVLDDALAFESEWSVRGAEDLDLTLTTIMTDTQGNFRGDMAVAPDGSAFAYRDIETGEINVVDREGTRALNVTASFIAWGAPLYTVVELPPPRG